MNIIEAIEDRRYLRPAFKELGSWRAWMVYLRALYGLGIADPGDLRLFRECTQLEKPPREPARESYCICGRRSGKTFISAMVAVYQACFIDWRPYLAAGETAYVQLMATDRLQATQLKNYIAGDLKASPVLRRLIKSELKESIELSNRVTFRITTASLRGPRSYSTPSGHLDEMCFLRDSETSANPSAEIIAGIRPALAGLPGSVLLGISSPYSRSGVMWEQYRRHYGQPGGPLIWKAPSLVMNPTLDAKLIERAIADDPAAGRSEWLADFREDLSALLPEELVRSCVITGRHELPRIRDVRYHAFIDPSGGRQDSFTCAVAHRERSGKVVLDCLRERVPPFRPEAVVEEFSGVLKSYGLSEVGSDRYSGEWSVDAFRTQGIKVVASELSASELFLELVPAISQGSIEILDNKRLVAQLAGLERRVRTGGKDLVSHFSGGHDDAAVALAGAYYRASRRASEGASFGSPSYSVLPDTGGASIREAGPGGLEMLGQTVAVVNAMRKR